jgi:predicted transposase/invertase (TIGR01784 family)
VKKVQEFVKEGKEREQAIRQGVIYCREHDILKEFMETHGTEAINMLMTEWNMDDALAVRFEEGWEGGMEKGMEKGREEGLEKGREEDRKDVARNALVKGLSLDLIHEITGLDIDTITNLQIRQ